MRSLLIALVLFSTPLHSSAQTPLPNASAALTKAVLGHWTGVLEYRDYSEPATSTKRVQLPTWLTIASAPEGVVFDYTYDDGPTKVVTEHTVSAFDLAHHSYKETGAKSSESYTISGDDKLRDGRGELILTGQGRDNDKPAEIRITWTVRRNLLSWLEEVRPSGSSEPFTFRHRYTFTRAEVPTPPRP